MKNIRWDALAIIFIWIASACIIIFTGANIGEVLGYAVLGTAICAFLL